MNADNNNPKRKNLRLKQHNYSSAGAYFITVCIKNRAPILSKIVAPVGVGALDDPLQNNPNLPQIQLTQTGKIIQKHLLSTEKIKGVKIDKFVIMPDHIHAIIVITSDRSAIQSNGSSRAPTPTNEILPHIVSTFKRFCNKEIGRNLFQRGYFDHFIRDIEDYETRVKYIYENPLRWYYSGKY